MQYYGWARHSGGGGGGLGFMAEILAAQLVVVETQDLKLAKVAHLRRKGT